jgi:hypothetical protein
VTSLTVVILDDFDDVIFLYSCSGVFVLRRVGYSHFVHLCSTVHDAMQCVTMPSHDTHLLSVVTDLKIGERCLSVKALTQDVGGQNADK